jgi:hypothetical protein
MGHARGVSMQSGAVCRIDLLNKWMPCCPGGKEGASLLWPALSCLTCCSTCFHRSCSLLSKSAVAPGHEHQLPSVVAHQVRAGQLWYSCHNLWVQPQQIHMGHNTLSASVMGVGHIVPLVAAACCCIQHKYRVCPKARTSHISNCQPPAKQPSSLHTVRTYLNLILDHCPGGGRARPGPHVHTSDHGAP